MKFDWLKARQTKYTVYASVYILVIVAVLATANFLAKDHNKSFDATANKRFSLSDQTEKVVKNLKQDVKISYFDRTSEFSRAKDLLDRYDNLSTKLTIDYVDPDKKPQAAKAMGVRNYGTIFVQAGANREEAKSLSEEEITGALIRALKSGQRTACAVSGSGEHSLDETERTSYSALKELLEKYKTKIVVEMNYSGQLASFIRQETGIEMDNFVLKYNGRPMSCDEVHKALRRVIRGEADKREVLTAGV